MKNNDVIVISVGGSLIVPDEINTDFLAKFKHIIETQINNGKRFIIIAGGGKTARRYQEATRALGDLPAEDLDWIGIHATRLNGHLLRTIFKDRAHPIVHHKLNDDIAHLDSPLIVAAGVRPGSSSDYVATYYAGVVGAQTLINLTNTDGVYNKDPKKYSDAQHFDTLDWSTFRNLLPKEWDPGLSSPFDPIAAREAEKLNLEVLILNGNKLEEFEKALTGESFLGTTISK